MRYASLGEIPAKRHVQFRDSNGSNGSGPLLVEEVTGYEGFSGNESILYHLQSPCRIAEAGEFTPIEHTEWVPDAHVHRHLVTGAMEPGGDPVTGRRCLMWNGDLEVSLCRPAEEMEGFYRDGEGDELIFVCEGSGTLETIYGDVPYREHDYIVIPRGTTYRFALDSTPADLARLPHPGRARDAEPVSQPLRPAARVGALLTARLPPPGRAADPP